MVLPVGSTALRVISCARAVSLPEQRVTRWRGIRGSKGTDRRRPVPEFNVIQRGGIA